MPSRITLRIFTACVGVAVGTCGLISCRPPATNGAPSAARAEIHPAGPVRDLSQDEAAGGHILRKHVGQTDEQLRERLEREPRLPAPRPTPIARRLSMPWAPPSRNRRTESSAGSTAPADIPTWCWITTARAPIGRTINRGENQSRPCAHALVVLKYAGPNDYYVLTSYPECR